MQECDRADALRTADRTQRNVDRIQRIVDRTQRTVDRTQGNAVGQAIVRLLQHRLEPSRNVLHRSEQQAGVEVATAVRAGERLEKERPGHHSHGRRLAVAQIEHQTRTLIHRRELENRERWGIPAAHAV